VLVATESGLVVAFRADDRLPRAPEMRKQLQKLNQLEEKRGRHDREIQRAQPV